MAASRLRRPVLARSGGRASRSASVAALRHTDEGERLDDFAIRQEWWTGEALPEAKVAARTGRVPKVEVVGLSKEKVEETSGHDHPGQGRPGGSPEEITSAISCSGWKKMGMATRHCRPGAS